MAEEQHAFRSDAEAAEHISGLLREEKPPAEATQTEDTEPQEVEESPEEPKAELEAREASPSEEETEAQAEPEGESEELPDTLQGLAEAIGLPIDEFSEHLKVPVKINGESRSVTLSEAIKGYQLEGDYSRKSSELAEARRNFEQEIQQRRAQVDQEVNRLSQLMQYMQSQIPQEPDLDTILENEGTEAYLRAKAQMDQRREALQRGFQEMQQQFQRSQAESQQRLAMYRHEQIELLKQKVPEFLDEKFQSTFEKEIVPYLHAEDYNDAEIQGFMTAFDHRQIRILQKAMKYDALQKGKADTKKLSSLPKVTKPGAIRGRRDEKTEKGNQALSNLRKLNRTGAGKAAKDAAATAYISNLIRG